MKKTFLYFFIITAVFTLSCKKSPKEDVFKKYARFHLKPAEVETSTEMVFVYKMKNIQVVELGSDNIAIWAENGIRNKTLILVDSMPNIQYEIPDEILLETKNLIDNNNYKILSNYTGLTKTLKRLYDSFNYIYAAHRLGIIKEVIWVMPIVESITFDYKDFFKQKLRDNPSLNFTSKDIDSFSFSNNQLIGSIFDIPVTITAIDDLEVPKEPVVLSINLSYLAAFVIDNVRSPIEDITVAFLKALSKKIIKTNYTTIVNSNRTSDVNMRFRFISNILKDMFTNPDLLQRPKREWIIKQSADHKSAFVAYDEAEKEYNEILKTTPDDPAIYFQLAILYIKRHELDKASYYIEEAAKRDKYYLLSYTSLMSELQSEDKRFKLLETGYKKHPENIPILSSIASLFFNKGKFQEALEAYLKLINLGVESYDLSFYVADCHFKLKNYEKAKTIYDNTFSLLTEEFKEIYSFYYINLAEVYEILNDNENAIKNYALFLKYNKNSPKIKSIGLKIKELKKK
jgi:tetratricopeptide (TPR) repeat protein